MDRQCIREFMGIRDGDGEIDDFMKSEMFTFHRGGIQILCRCPERVQEFRMELLKGTQIVCDLSKRKGSGSAKSLGSPGLCQSSNSSLSYFVNGLDRSHESSYSCKLSIFDPPPFQEILRREYLHIYESQLCCQLKFWLPIGCAAFAVVYICGCTFFCWFMNKKHRTSVHDPNSEYMFMAAVNTAKKPRLSDVAHNLGLSNTQG
ncbi:PREDICTED: inducible T-cell costimulator [Miniopterus natalensis]|uniref:inducible T-cell costimulator n=1 Tax=Miniopterus natalensis TaxID=291302 RepID=UPI0007A6B3DA|nr:PREDICTED: inducible T-cell costimulator [Miniopterus natalensis]